MPKELLASFLIQGSNFMTFYASVGRTAILPFYVRHQRLLEWIVYLISTCFKTVFKRFFYSDSFQLPSILTQFGFANVYDKGLPLITRYRARYKDADFQVFIQFLFCRQLFLYSSLLAKANKYDLFSFSELNKLTTRFSG